MSRISDYKIVTMAVGLIQEELEACDCQDELDLCPFCLLQAAREALERLAETDPFVEAPARVVADEPRIIE